MISSPFATHNLPYALRVGKFAYIDEVIVDCRLVGMNKAMLRGDYDRVKFNIIDMIDHLRKTPFIEMDKMMYDTIMSEFLHMRVESALRKFDDVHNRIRDLHFMILNSYSSQ
jgi:hypothetical protein